MLGKGSQRIRQVGGVQLGQQIGLIRANRDLWRLLDGGSSQGQDLSALQKFTAGRRQRVLGPFPATERALAR